MFARIIFLHNAVYIIGRGFLWHVCGFSIGVCGAGSWHWARLPSWRHYLPRGLGFCLHSGTGSPRGFAARRCRAKRAELRAGASARLPVVNLSARTAFARSCGKFPASPFASARARVTIARNLSSLGVRFPFISLASARLFPRGRPRRRAWRLRLRLGRVASKRARRVPHGAAVARVCLGSGAGYSRHSRGKNFIAAGAALCLAHCLALGAGSCRPQIFPSRFCGFSGASAAPRCRGANCRRAFSENRRVLRKKNAAARAQLPVHGGANAAPVLASVFWKT